MSTYKRLLTTSYPLVQQFLRLDRLINKPRVINQFWPSEATADVYKDDKVVTYGKCGRKIYYSLHDEVPSQLNYLSELRFKLGNMVEDNHVESSKYFADDVQTQLRLEIPIGNIQLNGYIDHVYKPINEDKYYVVEHKSSYGYWFEKFKLNQGVYDESHVIQIGLYMYAIRELNLLKEKYGLDSSDIETGKLIYTSRGNCELADDTNVDISKYDFNGKQYIGINAANEKQQSNPLVTVEALYNKMHNILNAVGDNILPNRDFVVGLEDKYINDYLERKVMTEKELYNRRKSNKDKDKSDWQCRYCDHRDKCKNDMLPNTKDANHELAIQHREALRVEYLERYGFDLNDIRKDYSDHEIDNEDE